MFSLSELVRSQNFEFQKTGYVHAIKLADLPASFLVVKPATNPSGFATIRYGIYCIFGQPSDAIVTDQDGIRLGFNSVISVVNFLSFNGWELVTKAEDILPDIKGILFRKRSNG
jgi:hypothetical protein